VQALLALAGEACTPAIAWTAFALASKLISVPTEDMYNDERSAWERERRA